MPDHIARKVRGPIPYSLDGVLSLLDPEEAAALRLGALPIHVTATKVPQLRRRWRRATLELLESPSVDDVRPLVELEVVFEDPPVGEDPREFWVESLRRLLFLEARLR